MAPSRKIVLASAILVGIVCACASLYCLWLPESIEEPRLTFPGRWPEFSPDGRLLLAVQGEDDLGIWETGSGAHWMTLPKPKRGTWLGFSADSRALTAADGRWLVFFDLNAKKIV